MEYVSLVFGLLVLTVLSQRKVDPWRLEAKRGATEEEKSLARIVVQGKLEQFRLEKFQRFARYEAKW